MNMERAIEVNKDQLNSGKPLKPGKKGK